jgi:hypothetical protein
MSRKQGDNNYANYVGYQAFSSDEPTHRINYTNWYLKFENNRPGFFLNAEKCFKQMPFETFRGTAVHKSKENSMAGYADQVKDYFNQDMEKIEQCLIKVKDQTK